MVRVTYCEAWKVSSSWWWAGLCSGAIYDSFLSDSAGGDAAKRQQGCGGAHCEWAQSRDKDKWREAATQSNRRHNVRKKDGISTGPTAAVEPRWQVCRWRREGGRGEKSTTSIICEKDGGGNVVRQAVPESLGGPLRYVQLELRRRAAGHGDAHSMHSSASVALRTERRERVLRRVWWGATTLLRLPGCWWTLMAARGTERGHGSTNSSCSPSHLHQCSPSAALPRINCGSHTVPG
jgi:hypothetical protein